MRKNNSNSFELLILGTSSATPSKTRHPSAHLLNIQEELFLIDCGEATQVRLFNHKIRWNQLGHILITHLHGDHVYGLPGLLSSMGLYQRENPLTIFGPSGIKEFVHTTLRLSHSQIAFDLQICEIDHTSASVILQDDKLTITAFPLDHRVPCIGYCFRYKDHFKKFDKELLSRYPLRIADIRKLKEGLDVTLPDGSVLRSNQVLLDIEVNKSYAYCSDTRYNERIIEYIKGVDLLYHETTYDGALEQKAEEMGHTTTLQVARIVAKANVQKLVTGHYSSRYHSLEHLLEECQGVFPQTILGIEDLRIKW